ncbi:MAG TPA: cysteine--tRNA ligase [Candidatus Nanopelagicaceae bacterium]|nr:cysteine--tRNA ligase [Candidatus Nanopelagicaceae bacterium]
MTLHLYDTSTRQTREFWPLVPGKVSIYLCGATVQAAPHIGHVRSGLNFDVLRRWLAAGHGYEVTFIRNVTDIDDKILANAESEGMPWWALALKYERAFVEAYAALNCLLPTYEPRATGHITQMIELMERLIYLGHAYAPGNGDVYMDVRSLDNYLSLSGQKLDELQPAPDSDRADEVASKKDPRDFALWKSAKPGEPSWQTPWGTGRPGWHLECSAMIKTYLGETFDIHGGGLDLIFPHHENEIAQSTAAGYGFAQLWMHNAWVTLSGEKMSKSLGNSLKVEEILKSTRGVELRWYLNSAHYRSMIEFSPEALAEAATGYRRIENFVRRAEESIGETFVDARVPETFASALDDDLAVPQALAVIAEHVRDGNTALAANDAVGVRKGLGSVRAMLSILGCDPHDGPWANESSDLTQVVDSLIQVVLTQRTSARERKDWAEADLIRDEIAAAGIQIEDSPSGSRWTYTPPSGKTEK